MLNATAELASYLDNYLNEDRVPASPTTTAQTRNVKLMKEAESP